MAWLQQPRIKTLLFLLTAGLPIVVFGPASVTAEELSKPAKQLVTQQNFLSLFPTKEEAGRFMEAATGPFSKIYFECVSYEAYQMEQGSADVRLVVNTAIHECRKYQEMMDNFMAGISEDSSSLYTISPGLRGEFLQGIERAATSNTTKFILKKKAGQQVRKPADPQILLDTLINSIKHTQDNN